MSHIIILDEKGNEIGSSKEGHRTEEEDHEATVVTVNLERVKDLMNGKEPDKG